MSKKWITRILLGFVVLLIASQFIRFDRSRPVTSPDSSFVKLAMPPTEIANLLKVACYDCHSYETTYPWYAQVAPISWWIDNHVNEGREHLNFSTWGSYSLKKQAHKAEEAAEEIEEGHMPERTYPWMHAEARLTAAQRTELSNYFKNLNLELKSIPAMPDPSMLIPKK